MKATTLLSAVALATACVGSAFGAVTSQNIVGYIKLSLTKGYNLVANQLNNGDNTVVTVFSGLPADDKTTAYKWNGRGYDTSTYFSEGGWDDPTLTAAPGDGVFIYVDAPTTVTLVGEVSLNTTVNLIKGYSLISSPIPVAGALTDAATVAFPKASVADGDVVFQWNGRGFDVNGYTFIDGSDTDWDAGEPPSLKVGEGFFIKKSTATTWTRTFSVN